MVRPGIKHTQALEERGRFDPYFGPGALTGKESNGVPTGAHGRQEAFFRLYSPEKFFFDKVWKLSDFERQKQVRRRPSASWQGE
jgi:hypothetical protein